jgi:CubicO group peptidase (beta-lactamase class C family)
MVDGELATSGGVTTGDGDAPNADTVFRIASMTKSFTAAAVLALRDEGVWSLDDPIARHAPELADARGPADSPAITLRHLLCMTAGMATDDAWADRHLDMTMDEIDDVYRAGAFFAHRTNDAFQYSNLGYGMLGRCVRRATGRTVQDHIVERFHRPLGMARTTWVEPAHDDWARPHRWQDGANVPDLPHPIGDGEISPMGGIWTTVRDLCAWISWLDDANGTEHRTDGTGLSHSSRRELQRMHTYVGPRLLAEVSAPSGYGFGLVVRDDPKLGKVVDHSGGLPGYGTNMRWVCGTRVGAIALANVTYAPMSPLTMAMLYALDESAGLPRAAMAVSPALRQCGERLVELLNDWSPEKAAALFADNVALDEALDRRAEHAQRLVQEHGRLRLLAVHPRSWANGELEVVGHGESFRIDLELSPLSTPLVQAYEAKP